MEGGILHALFAPVVAAKGKVDQGSGKAGKPATQPDVPAFEPTDQVCLSYDASNLLADLQGITLHDPDNSVDPTEQPLATIRATVNDAHQLTQQTIIGGFMIDLSHGCVHIHQQTLPILLSYGLDKNSTVTVHSYTDAPPDKLPPPLSKDSAQKYSGTDLRLEVYPGKTGNKNGELAVLFVKGKPVGYFKIGGGPETARMAANGKEATPTPTINNQKISAIRPYNANKDYPNSNLTGGSLVKVDESGQKVYYSEDHGKTWKPLQHPALSGRILDPKRRAGLVEPTSTKGVYKYVGNDFGNGYIDSKGKHQTAKIISVNGMGGSYFHSYPSGESYQENTAQIVVQFLVTPDASPESVLPQRNNQYHPLYVKIAKGKTLTPAEAAQLDTDPDLAGLNNAERRESIEIHSRFAYNIEQIYTLLEKLEPVRPQLLAAMESLGLSAEDLSLGVFVQKIMGGQDPKVAFTEFKEVVTAGGNAVLADPSSNIEFIEQDLSLKDGSKVTLEVTKDGGKVAEVTLRLTKKPGEKPLEFLARANQAKTLARGMVDKSIPFQEITREDVEGFVDAMSDGSAIVIDLYFKEDA